MKCFSCLKVFTNTDLSKEAETQPSNANEESRINFPTYERKLDSFFMLRKFLTLPQGVYKQLRDSGNPDFGIHCCDSCSSEVMKAKSAMNDLIKLQRQYTKIKQEINGAIVNSAKGQSQRNLLTVKSSDENETDIVRLFVTQEYEKYSKQGAAAGQNLPKETIPAVNKDHITVISGDSPSYFCNGCMTPFNLQRLIKFHQYCLGAEKPHVCKECGKGFVRPAGLNYHMKIHTGQLSYTCSICVMGFSTERNFTAHMSIHSNETLKMCLHCKEEFEDLSALKHHLMICPKKPSPVLNCPFCTETFSLHANFKEHLKSHDESFQCEECGKAFKLKASLQDHMRTHSTEKPEHKCEYCGKVFLKLKNFRKHLLTHSGNLPFKCSLCESAFVRSELLENHMKEDHSVDTKMEVEVIDLE